MSVTYRLATQADAPRILELYTPFVRDTAITFEYDPPSLEEFEQRIQTITAVYPYLLCETEDGVLAGYAYACPYKERAAYTWCAEVTIYISPAFQRRGLAGGLYQRLFALLRMQGCHSVYACIAHPNEPSQRFHASMGFEAAGLLRNAGYKLGRWWDAAWMQKCLVDLPFGAELRPPNPFQPIQALSPSSISAVLTRER